jgi:hypothetical protein
VKYKKYGLYGKHISLTILYGAYMKTLRVSEAVWKYLQERGRPFEDTPNDVLERLFEIQPTPTDETDETEPETTASGRTVQQAFRQPIIDALKALDPTDRRAHKNDVLAHLERTMALTTEDHEKDERGREAWKQRAAWEAVAMRNKGLLLKRKRGIWELVSKFEEMPIAIAE